MDWSLVLPFLATLVCLLLAYLWKKNRYFDEYEIYCEKPELLFGNMRKVFFEAEHMNDVFDRIYYKNSDLYVGSYNFLSPIIVIKDLELLKTILIKDFEHFVDHMEFTEESVDPLNGKTLFALKSDRWKEMRVTLSPAFTSSKMRGMMPLMEDRCNNLINYIRENINKKSTQGYEYGEFEMKNAFSRYANDVIASCAFGIEIDSFKDENNMFYLMVKKLTNIGFAEICRALVFFISPFLARLFKIEFSPKDATNFMREVVRKNMEDREKNKIVRPDMIHLLMLAKQGKLHDEQDPSQQKGDQKAKTEWTQDELTAQVMLFLFAGFETSSNLMSFMAYELAINPGIQAKLIKEIDEVLEKNNGKLDYTSLLGMKYLDMIANETLRMWPGLTNTDRICVKDYELPPPNKFTTKKYKIKKGDGIWVPLFSIQRDPKLYDEPDKFIPERFSDENKSKLPAIPFLTFGAGPRACIGSRFALMEVKLVFFNILKEFEFIQIPKTPVPMKLKHHLFNFIPVDGFMVGIKPRKRN